MKYRFYRKFLSEEAKVFKSKDETGAIQKPRQTRNFVSTEVKFGDRLDEKSCRKSGSSELNKRSGGYDS